MSENKNTNANAVNDLMLQRISKIDKIKEKGINPYPHTYKPTHYSADITENKDKLVEEETLVKLAGRVKSFRRMGKTAFMHIEDMMGKIQFYVRKDDIGEEAYEMVKLIDLGDFIGGEGFVFITKTGETSIKIKSLEMLSKAIRPLPVVKEADGKKFDEFSDVELKYRQRYVDLAVNTSVRDVFIARSKIIASVRRVLMNKGFLEVETPSLQTIYGGANARPFKTHHNALDIDLFLRISPELYLKRLIVGGFDKVFDLSKNFRNEGIDRTHNPEFTMLESYQAYADFKDMMRLTEELYQEAAKEVLGSTKIKYQGLDIELGGNWKELKMVDAIREIADIDVEKLNDDELTELAKKYEIDLKKNNTRGLIINKLFEETCEDKLIQPTFITHHPKETTPLCKQAREDGRFVERFEPFINGWEIGNAYTELNDPILQRALFEEQAERRLIDDEAHPMDDDFVRAIEYGMPPTGGLGLGIDRMIMLITDQTSIRDVILFPHMKPEK